jgi:hypothetical protein
MVIKMALPRLKRQDFHIYLCGIVLILVQTIIYYMLDSSVANMVIYAIVYTFGIYIFDACNTAIRQKGILFARHIVCSLIVSLFMAAVAQGFYTEVVLFLLTNLAYILWLPTAMAWMHRQFAPAWTLIVYDTKENLVKAQAAIESRPDLIQDSYHVEYHGEDDMDKVAYYIDIFKIGQMLICLDGKKDIDQLSCYCEREGIVAITPETKGQEMGY